jgi:hypothetical protein
MNIVAVFLGIIIVILVYILYTYITKPSVDFNELVYLKTDSKTIDASKVKSPTSAQFTYAAWVYVNSWGNSITKKLITTGGTPNFKLYLDTSSPTLKADFKGSANPETVILMQNFPIQKWCYVIVSVDNKIMDFYLDGKLVLSKQLSETPTTSSSDSIVIGDSSGLPDIYMAKISRWPNVIDPQTAWDTYMAGNGQSNSLNPQYNVKLSVLNNNIETKNFSLF